MQDDIVSKQALVNACECCSHLLFTKLLQDWHQFFSLIIILPTANFDLIAVFMSRVALQIIVKRAQHFVLP